MFFSAPIKGTAQCYASLHSAFHEYVWSHDAGKACNREGYITQATNILLVLSLHINLHDLLFSSSDKRLWSLYRTFYLCCERATFLCARTPHNAMRRTIESCLLNGQRKHLWIVFSFKCKNDPTISFFFLHYNSYIFLF